MKFPTGLTRKYGKPIKTLGQGGYGKVVQTSKGYAVKIIGNGKGEGILEKNSSVMLEYSSMNNVDSPYIMNLIDIRIYPERIYLVLPLGKVIPNMIPPSETKDTFLQMCYGVADFHSADMTHQDLKPENFIRVEDKVLLADFGLTQINICANLTPPHIGFTLWWRPPEFLFGKDSTQAGDIWALGVILLTWLTQKQPFLEEVFDDFDFLVNIFKTLGFPTEATWPGVSNFERYPLIETLNLPNQTQFLEDKISDPTARDLVGKMLSLNPAKRPTIYEVLAHPYFGLDLPEKYLNPPGCIDTLLERIHPYSQARIPRDKYLTISEWLGELYSDDNFFQDNALAQLSYAVSLFNFVDRNLNEVQLNMVACLYIGAALYEYDPLGLSTLVYYTDDAYSKSRIEQRVIEINRLLDYNIIISHPYAFARVHLQTHGDLDLLPLMNNLTLIFLCSSVGREYSPDQLGFNLYDLAKRIKAKSERTPIQIQMVQEIQEDVIYTEPRSSKSLSDLYRDLGVWTTYIDLIEIEARPGRSRPLRFN